MTLLLKRIDSDAIVPIRIHSDDAGLDLFVIRDYRIQPGQFLDLDTGWDIKVPDGYWGSVKARSSTFFKRGLVVHEGTIDSGYTGPLKIGVYNPKQSIVLVKARDRIAQLVLIPLVIGQLCVVNELPMTERGRDGFGSSDPGIGMVT